MIPFFPLHVPVYVVGAFASLFLRKIIYPIIQ